MSDQIEPVLFPDVEAIRQEGGSGRCDASGFTEDLDLGPNFRRQNGSI